MNDFHAEPAALRVAMQAAVQRVMDSGWYVLGREGADFERQWAENCGVIHGIGVGNGLDALEISLRALAIGPGDEVITTPMTAFATVLAITRAGATPVLADIDPDTALLTPTSVARCLTPRSKAVLLVHLYGQVRAMQSWQDFCRQHGLWLIEDGAQAHLATWRGQVAGSFGAVGAYSFYPTKNLGALGDAGMLVTADAELAAHARRLRNYGQSERYYHPELGLNSRLDEIQAALLTARLPWLQAFTQRRQQIAHYYHTHLHNPQVRCLALPEEPMAHVYHLYVICCPQRDALQAHLHRCGVQTLIHYPVPVHAQAPCRTLARDPVGLAASERHAATCLSLPCHPQLSDADLAQVADAVNRFRG